VLLQIARRFPGVDRGICVVALAVLLIACGPIMYERDGHRVFNAAYLRFLDSSWRDEWQQPEAVLADFLSREYLLVFAPDPPR
jgi:hypothetical protein